MTASEMSPKASSAPGRYRIGAVAHATGLTTHTIRVWERRYQAVNPQRTPGGDRLYSDADIQRLRLLRRLQQAGHGIGTIAELPAAELEAVLARYHDAPETPSARHGVPLQTLRAGFLDAVRSLDQAAANGVLSTATATLPARVLVYDLLAPVLEEIGARWEAGELHIAHEHAATAVLREHIAVLMRVHGGRQRGRRVLITTPAGELHEFGALLAAVLLAVSGCQVHYLGPNLPAAEIARAALLTRSETVLLSWVCAEPDAVRPELEALRGELPRDVEILIGGRAVANATPLPAGVSAMESLAALEEHVQR